MNAATFINLESEEERAKYLLDSALKRIEQSFGAEISNDRGMVGLMGGLTAEMVENTSPVLVTREAVIKEVIDRLDLDATLLGTFLQ